MILLNYALMPHLTSKRMWTKQYGSKMVWLVDKGIGFNTYGWVQVYHWEKEMVCNLCNIYNLSQAMIHWCCKNAFTRVHLKLKNLLLSSQIFIYFPCNLTSAYTQQPIPCPWSQEFEACMIFVSWLKKLCKEKILDIF